MSLKHSALLAVTSIAVSCGAPPCAESTEACALQNVKGYVQTNLDELNAASTALCAAAPAPDADGWSDNRDTKAVEAMRSEWKRARAAYERIEGAIAVLFPELDVATDERYDGFVEAGVDTDLFDDTGVTGMHALERILWAGSAPQAVVDFEKSLGAKYVAAAFPTNEAEASGFKTKLCARLVTDTAKMKRDFAPLALDAPSAFRGVIGSMTEQHEKVTRAASGEEESRYAQFTLADLRANLVGGRKTFEAFSARLKASPGGAALHDQAIAAFTRLDTAYAALSGDQLPPPPATWSATAPTDADKATPFGKLFVVVLAESDAKAEGSLVNVLDKAANAMGIPQLTQ